MKPRTLKRIRKHTPTITAIAVIIAYVIAAWLMTTKLKPDYYATTAVVTEVNKEDKHVLAMNSTHVFAMHKTDGWEVGDCISILMDGKHTSTTLDDKPVDYSHTNLDEERESRCLIYTTLK